MSTPSPHEALADLVADVRAALEDAALRGVRAVPADQALPTAEVPPATASPAPPGTAAPPSPSSPEPRPAATEPSSSAPVGGLFTGPPAAFGEESLQQVRADLGDCTRCGLCQARRNIVFGVGDPQADLMVIGEAPGFQEDQRGEPFVGPAGEMLDNMLTRVIGLRRDQVYIANIVKCRPPDNRNPLPPEVQACLPFLHRQIRSIAPKLILVLGSVAFKSLFDTTAGITRSRGEWRTWEQVPVMPTFHPAYLLRRPGDKRLTFEDLKAVKARYDALGGRR